MRLVVSPFGVVPVRAPDDLVVGDLAVFSALGDALCAAPLLDREPQDLTGLVGAASARRALPEEEPARNPTPFRLLSEERRERLWVSTIERISSTAELVNHGSSVPR